VHLTPPEIWRLGYRPALDGLRGIAVALVLLSHANVRGFDHAGDIGVTMFFVLSGFLITALLVAERERSGRVDLIAFYLRRILRLMPALVVVCAAVALWLVVNGQVSAVPRTTLPALTYTADWFAATQRSMGLLTHTWSLAVEEHFYLIWPAVFLACMALGGGRLHLPMMVLSSAAVASLLERMVLLSGMGRSRVLWAADTRMDAILIGCLLALVVTAGWRAPRYAGWLGAAGIVAAMTLIRTDADTVNWGLLLVAIGTAAAIAAVVRSEAAPRWLIAAPFVDVGRISYGLYLWHYAIIVEGHRLLTDWQPAIAAGLLIAVSVAVAAASYHLVEKPFLRLRMRAHADMLSRSRGQDVPLPSG
jgi:peptidoglycan/LPS O-acetylase OafA/YrhL